MVAPLSSPSPSSTSATSSTGRHLPASTSESALAARARLGNKQPPPPPPPAQPKRVRPFILRARNSAAPAASSSSKARAADSEEADVTSQLRKSKTSCDLEASAGSSPTRPRQTKTARDHENVPPPPLAHHHRSSPTRAKKRIARPISLATNSLRAIGSFSSSAASASGSNTGSSAAAAGTAKPAGGIMSTRRRPLSYVVSSSSPPRTRHTPATTGHRAPSTSPSRTRTPRARMSAPSPDESPSSSRRAATTTTATGGTSRASNSSTASRMSALPSFSSSSAAASPRTLASPPHAVKTQSRHAAVELHKSALKRKTLEERQQARGEGGATSPSAIEPFADSGANTPLESMSASAATESAAMARGGLTRSRRWFGKLEPEQDEDPCAHTHLDDTPTAATQRELDAYATPPPPAAARVSSAARKKASYAALPVHHPDSSDRAPEEQPATHHTGYTSLQELLEQHGYADTRVITPHSTTQTARIRSAMADDVRADLFSYPDGANEDGDDDEEVEVLASPLANRTRNRSSSPGPKRLPKTAEDVPTEPKELKERPSLLSLRGLFSFFGSSAVDVEEDLATSPQLGFQERAEQPSPPLTTTLESEATPVPQRLRTVSEMHRWVETVNEVYPPPPMPPIPGSTTSSATAVMPELHFEHTADDDEDDDDDAASCRSYSSSISFSGSPPTPQPLFGGVDYGVVAPSSFSGSHLSPPVPVHDADLPRNKRLSLRHTVSDSNLLPSYQSFAGLGISAPSPPAALRSQLAATRPAQMDLVATGRETTAMITSSSSAAATASGLWGTTLLRTRASQLFSLAMARSPVDAATGRSFFTMPPPPLARPEPTTFRSAPPYSRAPPKLLRKAVSSAGLVSAPQVRRTRVVTKASWESFGSLEAKVSLEGGRPGSAASGGEADLDGGIGWGEDLLGRAWA